MDSDGPGCGHRRLRLGVLVAAACAPGMLLVLNGLRLSATSPDLCPVHRITGMWCPLCGGTRATRALLHGSLTEAIGYNPFALVVEALAVLLVLRWLTKQKWVYLQSLISTKVSWFQIMLQMESLKNV